MQKFLVMFDQFLQSELSPDWKVLNFCHLKKWIKNLICFFWKILKLVKNLISKILSMQMRYFFKNYSSNVFRTYHKIMECFETFIFKIPFPLEVILKKQSHAHELLKQSLHIEGTSTVFVVLKILFCGFTSCHHRQGHQILNVVLSVEGKSVVHLLSSTTLLNSQQQITGILQGKRIFRYSLSH